MGMQCTRQWLMAAIVLAAHTASWPANAAVPTQDELITAYEAKHAAIRTLLLRTSSTTRIVADPSDAFRHFGTYPPLPQSGMSVQHHDGRYYAEMRNPWNVIDGPVYKALKRQHPPFAKGEISRTDLPFSDVQQAAEVEFQKLNREVPPLIFVFDGEKVWKHESYTELTTRGVTRKVFSVLDPERVSGPLLPGCLSSNLLITFSVPEDVLPKDHIERSENRLPDILETGEFRIRADLQDVAGKPCVVLESSDQQIYLDPEINFAVRRRLWKHTDGKPVYELVADSFEEVLPALWLPRKALYRQYGIAEIADGQFAGVLIHENHVDVTRIELNRPEHESYFSVDVQPGNWVADETLAALDSAGRDVEPVTPRDRSNVVPTVSYIQPADKADLDQVISEARSKAGKEPTTVDEHGMSTGKKIVIWLNLGVLAIVIAGIAYRKRFVRS